MMTDDEFLEAFETGSMPEELWTHAAHFRMAWLYLDREPDETAAMNKAREGIQHYLLARGKTPDKYNETITRAYIRLVGDRMAREDAPDTCVDFLARNHDLSDAYPGPLAQYYSEALLESEEARTHFVAPDRMPLPRSALKSHG